ncbi:hypothetical protein D9758_011212 [Tetrapyrgos nigripes]|uniref:Uncharacterized protein n=1 Tax=Tetrapyrgos nigripes TaxID=182062 RepID=A0A8H5D6P5_9AGAR|nr:hypothetical protein D9758_011212 [Tetrapyrgos nigripes]
MPETNANAQNGDKSFNSTSSSPNPDSVGNDYTSISDSELSQADFEKKCSERIGLRKMTPAEEMVVHDPLLKRPESVTELEATHNRILSNLRSRISTLQSDELFEQTLFKGPQIGLEETPIPNATALMSGSMSMTWSGLGLGSQSQSQSRSSWANPGVQSQSHMHSHPHLIGGRPTATTTAPGPGPSLPLPTNDIDSIMRSMMGPSSLSVRYDPYRNATYRHGHEDPGSNGLDATETETVADSDNEIRTQTQTPASSSATTAPSTVQPVSSQPPQQQQQQQQLKHKTRFAALPIPDRPRDKEKKGGGMDVDVSSSTSGSGRIGGEKSAGGDGGSGEGGGRGGGVGNSRNGIGTGL